jgi:HAD superfamily hydrolase (TIGR01490 family)
METTRVTLAIFDLDNTLLAGDSDHAWGQYLVDQGIVDPDAYQRANDQFYQDYLNGCLDMAKYLEFSLAPLTAQPLEALLARRTHFVETRIMPMILPKGKDLLQRHREQGHELLIITATNRFVTQPIAELLNVDDLIATDPEFADGAYTGRVVGIPSFREGKVVRLHDWLANRTHDLAES